MAEKYMLNRSQTEILASETASPGSAINTVSLRLHLQKCGASAAYDALTAVLSSADIFSASLCREGNEWYFIPGQRHGMIQECSAEREMSLAEAEAYADAQDCLPLLFPDELYRAEIIPLREGGVIVYIRFHHIIIDGYGMSLMAQRILDSVEGKPVGQSVFFTGAYTEDTRTDSADTLFWKNHLDNCGTDVSVFTEVSKNDIKTVYRTAPDTELYRAAQAFAKENGVTVPYVLFSAYALYLAEATGHEEAVILMPRLNRRSDEMNTIGCYTLLIPLKIRTERDESFSQLCKRTMNIAKEASAHKGIGYGNILRAADISGSLSQYVFNYYRYSQSSGIAHELTVSVAGAMRNHLTWNVFLHNDGLAFSYDLRNGVYDEKRAEYFCDGIKNILADGFRDKAVKDMIIVGERERSELSQIRGAASALPDDETIPSLFCKAVQKFSDRPAVYSGNDTISFAELDRMSDRIASALTVRGVHGGDTVAFMLPRDIRLIPTMLGILKTGASFVPLDPAYPEDRINYISDDSGAAYLISTKSVAGNRGFLEIDELIQCDKPFTAPAIRQSQTAYMIYTSGTTGRPKGVMLSHRGIINIVRPDNNPFNRDITRNCRGIVAIGSVCFDISLFEIFVPLMNGLFVELGNEKAMFDADELAEAITRHGADTLHCTPSRLASYLGKPDFSRAVKNVKAILSAGEVLPQGLADELKNNYKIRIYNGYGPTETTIGATITEAGDNKTIGKPIGNTGILILNRHGKQVPLGAVGEICIYGDGVGLGYRGREEETRQKFTDRNGTRIYHTGDLGHIDRDGNIIYHGRNDRQIKLRGLRIELAEIERVMCSYPGVTQGNCIVRKLGRSEHLVGFYTVDTANPVAADKLKAHMKSSLTAYMVPDILKELEAMPQTPGGKTDLRALEKIEVEPERIYRAPGSRTEELICLAFASVLNAGNIGMDDNFFELGGDSLRSVELMLEIEKNLGLADGKLEYTDIYRCPTPAMIADKLAETETVAVGYDIASLDYKGIGELLDTPKTAAPEKRSLGNVLLTGSTGYLGIHILIELLQNPDICGHIYCLARANKRLSAEKRVRNTLFYYAEEDFGDCYGSKWSIVEGDITDPEIVPSGIGDKIDTVINSAANVAHFAYGDALKRINIDGVNNLIAFALSEKAMLCQISTISVGGVYKDDNGKKFTEGDLYIGQEIYNEYIYTKYMAEYSLLRAAVDRGLRCKIMRVGNLQGRSRDGEFQMNMKSNAFTRQLSSYIKMGAAPESVYYSSVNFSPIDDTAHMITALAATPESGCVCHVYPPQEVAFERIFAVLAAESGKFVRVLPDSEFDAELCRLKHTEDGKELVEGLLTERPGGAYRYYPVIQDRTNDTLRKLRESWTQLSDNYLKKYLNALGELDLF